MRYYVQESDFSYPSGDFPAHLHDKTEIYLLLKGDSEFVVGDKAYALAPYDAVIIPPGVIHHCVLPHETRHDHACFWIDNFGGVFQGQFSSPDFPIFVRFEGETLSDVKRCCAYFKEKHVSAYMQQFNEREIAEENDKDRHFNAATYREAEEYAETTLFLSAILKSAKRNNEVEATSSTTLVPEALLQILHYIDERFAEISRLEDISEKLALSTSTVHRLFKKYLAITPKKYLEEKKLSKSIAFMREGTSVSAAASRAGFPDASNFTRLFKRRFGMTPKKFTEQSE